MNDDVLIDSLQDLYEQAPCGYIFTLADGTIARVNETFVTWLGCTREELVSVRRFQDLLTVPGRIFYENQYAPLLRMQGFVNEVAFDLQRPGREPLPVLVNSVQRRGADGPELVTASIIFDATERRAYERELLLARRRTEQLAAIVTAASDAIVSVSAEGEITTVNAGAERLFGTVAPRMLGQRLEELLPLTPDLSREEIRARLEAGEPVYFESAIQQPEGRRVDVSVGLTPHPGLLGELSAVSAIIRDISERRALERLQQEFLAMASHELRNPVGTIKGYAQFMQRSGQFLGQAVDAIVTQADQLGRLIDDLLLASQIAADRLELRPQAIDLVAEVRTAVQARLVDRAAIDLVAPEAPLRVQADRHRLGQVLTNLLTNAVKYSPAESVISVSVGTEGAAAWVAVRDRGAGIAPEAVPHLFERFYRVAGTAQQVQGVGLGLYITRRIVEAHGGRIEVASEVGAGSTFTVWLPLLVDAATE